MPDLPDDDHYAVDNEDKASKLKGFVWLASAILFGCSFAFGISPLAHAIPWSWEESFAKTTDLQEANFCRRHQASEAALTKLAQRLYPLQPDDDKFSITVNVVKEDDINAYAGFGGQIVINSGLLKQAQTPEEVAGVLAHEIEHVRHRDIMQGVITNLFTSQGLQIVLGDSSAADWAGTFINMDFTKGQERKADKGGLERLQKAHIDNTGFVNFFERMEKDNPSDGFLSDHPDNQSRVDMARSFSNTGTKLILTKNEWAALKGACD